MVGWGGTPLAAGWERQQCRHWHQREAAAPPRLLLEVAAAAAVVQQQQQQQGSHGWGHRRNRPVSAYLALVGGNKVWTPLECLDPASFSHRRRLRRQPASGLSLIHI